MTGEGFYLYLTIYESGQFLTNTVSNTTLTHNLTQSVPTIVFIIDFGNDTDNSLQLDIQLQPGNETWNGLLSTRLMTSPQRFTDTHSESDTVPGPHNKPHKLNLPCVVHPGKIESDAKRGGMEKRHKDPCGETVMPPL